MSKYIYIAMETQNPESKKYYPVVCPVLVECSDVVSALEQWAGSNRVVGSLVCATKKRACEIVEAWREGHRRNGDYEFNDTF